MDTMGLIEQAFGLLVGKRLLDIGCGDGGLVRTLAARGVTAAGVDPAAVCLGTDGPLFKADAQALPFGDGTFDGAVFVNSLHHVPEAVMGQALAEAARVTGSGRTVAVIEPLASGRFFAALKIIEDETTIRAAAQEAVMRAVGAGVFTLAEQIDYERADAFAGIEPFLAKVMAADAARARVIERERAAIVSAFEAAALRDEEGRFVLEQPIRAQILRVC